VEWSSFKRFLKDRCSERVIADRVRYAQKFGYCLLNRDFSELNGFAESKRRHALEGLSALAKFLGIYEDFRELVKAYGLKWASSTSEDLLISRMNKVYENGDVLKWVSQVKARFPELHTFIDFMLASGLRFEETINSYNLIINLSKEGKLSSYYDREKQILEHYRFKTMFIRRTKKAFISFIPESLIERISRQEKFTRAMIDNRLKRSGFKSRFSDVREYYATYMTRFLNPAEIDFLQGRVSASVFMRNYFNPALIGDLKERVFKGIECLMG
jgi:intergrase/recombinase